MKENEFTGITQEEAERFIAKEHPEFMVYKAEFQDNFSYYLTEREGRGMVRLYVDKATNRFFVCDLSVAPSARRKGLADTMLSLAEGLVRLHHRHIIHLYGDSCSWVTEWYARRGYAKAGEMNRDGFTYAHMTKFLSYSFETDRETGN